MLFNKWTCDFLLWLHKAKAWVLVVWLSCLFLLLNWWCWQILRGGGLLLPKNYNIKHEFFCKNPSVTLQHPCDIQIDCCYEDKIDFKWMETRLLKKTDWIISLSIIIIWIPLIFWTRMPENTKIIHLSQHNRRTVPIQTPVIRYLLYPNREVIAWFLYNKNCSNQ